MSVTVCRLPQTRSASHFDCAAGRNPIRAGELRSRGARKNAPGGASGQIDYRLDVGENEGGGLAQEPKQRSDKGVPTIPRELTWGPPVRLVRAQYRPSQKAP
jgi:hypothetical protein